MSGYPIKQRVGKKSTTNTYHDPPAWIVCSILLFQLVSFGCGAPVSSPTFQSTLQNPCGRDLNSQQLANELSLDTVQNNIAVVKSAENVVGTLINEYKDKLSSRKARKYSRKSKYHLEGLKTNSNASPAVSDPDNVWTDTSNQLDVFTKHHYDTTLLIVYIRQAIEEQIRYDGGHLVSTLQHVEAALLNGVLCGQDTALREMGQSPMLYADGDDIPSSIRDQRFRSRRYVRDFIVTNNIEKQLSLMEVYYTRLYDILNTTNDTQ